MPWLHSRSYYADCGFILSHQNKMAVAVYLGDMLALNLYRGRTIRHVVHLCIQSMLRSKR